MVFPLLAKVARLEKIEAYDGTVSISLGSGTVTIDGNLNVLGDVTYVHTSDLYVQDNIIVVNYGETGAGVSLGEAGISIDRGTLADSQIIWDETNDKFVFRLESGTLVPISASKVETNELKDAGQGYITLSSHLIPISDNTIDLGSPDKKWRYIYTNKLEVTDTANLTADLNISGNIAPTADNTYNLGSATNRFANIYGVNVHASSIKTNGLTDNGQGYITLSSHIIPAVDNTIDLGSPTNMFRYIYTHKLKVTDTASLDTDLNIGGSIIPTADNTYDLGSSTNRWANAYIINIYATNVNASTLSGFTVTGDIIPDADNTRDLGNASFRWANIYGVNLFGEALGIGTTSPEYKIHVISPVNNGILVESTGDHPRVALEGVDANGVHHRLVLQGGYFGQALEILFPSAGYYVAIWPTPNADSTNTVINPAVLRWAAKYWDSANNVSKNYNFELIPELLDNAPTAQFKIRFGGKDWIKIHSSEGIIIDTSVKPASDNAYNLGDTSHRFANIYSKRLVLTNVSGQEDWGIVAEYTDLGWGSRETLTIREPEDNNKLYLAIVDDVGIVFNLSAYPRTDNALNLGDANHRWKAVYCVDLYTGDIKLMNNWVITERDENGNIIPNGVRILNDKGEEIFRITEDGIYFKGKKLKLVFEE